MLTETPKSFWPKVLYEPDSTSRVLTRSVLSVSEYFMSNRPRPIRPVRVRSSSVLWVRRTPGPICASNEKRSVFHRRVP